MILRFGTKRNQYGYRKYLAIDTFRNEYTTNNAHIGFDGMEVKATDYKKMLEAIKNDPLFKEVDYI